MRAHRVKELNGIDEEVHECHQEKGVVVTRTLALFTNLEEPRAECSTGNRANPMHQGIEKVTENVKPHDSACNMRHLAAPWSIVDGAPLLLSAIAHKRQRVEHSRH